MITISFHWLTAIIVVWAIGAVFNAWDVVREVWDYFGDGKLRKYQFKEEQPVLNYEKCLKLLLFMLVIPGSFVTWIVLWIKSRFD